MRLLERLPVGDGPYALATTEDGTVWTSLVRAGALHRSGSGDLLRWGPQARPMLVVADGDVVHVTRGDGTISTVGATGSVRDVALPSGTEPYGLAVTAEGLWFSGLNGVVGRIDAVGAIEVVALAAGSMPGPLTPDPGGDGVWGTCFGSDALLRWRRGSSPELLPLGAGHGPVGICADGDGVRWAEITTGTVGSLGPDGSVHRVRLPGAAPRPHAVLPDGAGGTFVTCWGADALAHVADDGTVTALAFAPGDEPHGLCLDRDGNVRVALESGFVAIVDVVDVAG